MESLIHCLTELEKLKTVERGLTVGSRKESTAEHTWGCMLTADILIELVDEPLDRFKVLEYLLYHDVAEVYAGDAKFNNPEEMKLKHKKEAKAINRILRLLPNPKRYQTIISEYEERVSREAEFAKAIDCIDACIRNLNDESKNTEDGFTESLIREKYTPHVSRFKITRDLFEMLMKRLKDEKKL